MNKLYTEKLLDNEAFTQTTDSFESNVRSGKSVFWGNWGSLSCLKSADKCVGRNYYFLAGLTSDLVTTPTYLYYPEFTSSARVWVSKDTK